MAKKKAIRKQQARQAAVDEYFRRKTAADQRAMNRYKADKSAAEARERSLTMLAKEHTGGQGPVTGPVVQRSQAKAGEANAGTELQNVETRKSSGMYSGQVLPSGGSKRMQRKYKRTMLNKRTGSGASKQAKAAHQRAHRL